MNKSFDVKPFRGIPIPFPRYAIDNIGHIDFQQEKWEYRYGLGRSIIIFEGGSGQQKTNQELHQQCEDVINIASEYSAHLICTLGEFHTDRKDGNSLKAFFSPITREITIQILRPSPANTLILTNSGLQRFDSLVC
jgi:uncharacterized protein